MVAPQDPQSGRLIRAADFSTCAEAAALQPSISKIASRNFVCGFILGLLSPMSIPQNPSLSPAKLRTAFPPMELIYYRFASSMADAGKLLY